jgi:hypothetical protein
MMTRNANNRMPRGSAMEGVPAMTRTVKVGRNDTCGCGSGKKFKRCCGAKEGSLARGGRGTLVVLLGLIVGALALGVASFTTDRSSTAPRQVWSAEHGHYHDVR